MTLPFQNLGDYKLLHSLESHGYAESFLARQKSLSREVVLKILSHPDPHALRRFKEESKILADLSDPRIAAIHDFGEEKGLFFFTLANQTGVSLAEFLQRATQAGAPEGDVRQLLPEISGEDSKPYQKFVLGMVAEMAEALEKVHRIGVVHRDLRPENVLITESGKPLITDFGLARSGVDQSFSTSMAQKCRNPYSSPEQLASPKQTVDFRTDIFSLGVMLYELLTLQHPFGNRTLPEAEKAILDADAPSLRRARSTLSHELEAIVAKAMETDPARRYLSAGALAEDLRRFLNSEAVLATPRSRTGRLLRWARQRKAWAAASFAGTLLAAAAWVSAPDFEAMGHMELFDLMGDQTFRSQDEMRLFYYMVDRAGQRDYEEALESLPAGLAPLSGGNNLKPELIDQVREKILTKVDPSIQEETEEALVVLKDGDLSLPEKMAQEARLSEAASRTAAGMPPEFKTSPQPRSKKRRRSKGGRYVWGGKNGSKHYVRYPNGRPKGKSR